VPQPAARVLHFVAALRVRPAAQAGLPVCSLPPPPFSGAGAVFEEE